MTARFLRVEKSGFWAHRGAEELAYVPQPPAPRDEQPQQPPDDQHFWVPGNWQYVHGEFQWKPGFWAEARDGLVWMPDSYAWTPRGHIFVRGYWDLPLESRGMLCAPLAVTPGAVRRVSPTVLIDVSEALVNWFVAPSLQHYCFGDYYDVPAAKVVSWYEYGAGSRYDPLQAYYSRYHAQQFGSWKSKHKSLKTKALPRPSLTWGDYYAGGERGLAYALSTERLPAGLASLNLPPEEFGAVNTYYRGVVDRRLQYEQGTAIAIGRAPAFVQLDTFLPPGHGGLPPGLAKKGLIPPGFGGAPPGQTRKIIESFGPIAEKPGKGKGGGGGKGKGKGR